MEEELNNRRMRGRLGMWGYLARVRSRQNPPHRQKDRWHHASNKNVQLESTRGPAMYVQIGPVRSATGEGGRSGRETRDVGERAKVEAIPRNGELENTSFRYGVIKWS